MRAAVLLLLTVNAMFLSACVDSPGEPLDATPEGEDTASIQGSVVSDEVFPVRGANVSILDGPSTTTDEEGLFSFEGLTPGTLTINVTAAGYVPKQEEVSLSAGDALEIRVTVEGVPGASPYFETVPFDGIANCNFVAVYSAQVFPPGDCPLGERVTQVSVDVGKDWRGGVHEIAWETDEEMILASSLTDGCQTGGPDGPAPCPHLSFGASPIRAYARINDTEYAAKYAIDGQATWHAGAHTSFLLASYNGYFRNEINQTAYPVCVEINRQFNVPEHWGCPFGVGYATGLRFTFYHTTFYHDAPTELEKFTAVPDQ